MKTKINSKIIMALGTILLAVLVLNSSIVNAAEIDETYVKNLKLTSPKYYEVDLDTIQKMKIHGIPFIKNFIK